MREKLFFVRKAPLKKKRFKETLLKKENLFRLKNPFCGKSLHKTF